MFFYDGKILVIGKFLKIYSIDEKLMKFEYKNYFLQVEGMNLSLPYLEDNEVGVKGLIKSISIIGKTGDKNV